MFDVTRPFPTIQVLESGDYSKRISDTANISVICGKSELERCSFDSPWVTWSLGRSEPAQGKNRAICIEWTVLIYRKLAIRVMQVARLVMGWEAV